MQKYILTDQNGNTAENFQLQEGKKTHSINTKSGDPMVGVLTSAKDSALLAALSSEELPGTSSRLFMLNTWKVGVDTSDPRAYTVVKEVPLPSIGIHHKIAFTLALVSQVFSNDQFVKWAGTWISGEDRSADSAKAIRKSMKEELDAAASLADLAAWGASNDGDDETIARQRDGEQRAMYVATAAEFVASPDYDIEEVCSALGQAIKGIEKFTNRKDMAEIAEHVVKCTS